MPPVSQNTASYRNIIEAVNGRNDVQESGIQAPDLGYQKAETNILVPTNPVFGRQVPWHECCRELPQNL